MENETLKKYFDIKHDTAYRGSKKINFDYLAIKPQIKGYWELNNEELKSQIKSRIDKESNGLYYKGFYICFTYKNDLFYIKHYHESDNFIEEIIEILKYQNASDIFIKYGRLD